MSVDIGKTRRIALTGAVLGALLTFTAAPDPAAPARSASSERVYKVVIDNFTFEPKTLMVAAGTVVTWLNEDDEPHVVIGTDPESPIKSQPLDTGGRYSLTLTKPGTYRYFCSLHPHMTGTVVVE